MFVLLYIRMDSCLPMDCSLPDNFPLIITGIRVYGL
jgi:hypothetical protein